MKQILLLKRRQRHKKESSPDLQNLRGCQKQSTTKILNPATKESAVCGWETHAFLYRETHFWSSDCILSSEIGWQKILYGSFQRDNRVLHCSLKGVQCEAESQTTIHILIPSTQCFIILLYLYLNIFKSSDPTKVMNNLVGCSADAVPTQPRNTVTHHLCLPAEEGSRNGLDIKWLYNLENTSKSHLLVDVKHTVQRETKPILYVSCCPVPISISHLAIVPCNRLEVKCIFSGVSGKMLHSQKREGHP